MKKCPRCKIPQKGIHRCQYCGYDLSKNKKPFKTIRNNLENIIGALNNDQKFAKKAKMKDHFGTCSRSDKGKYKYMHYYLERRSGKDRRKRVDHRGQVARKKV